MDQIEEKDIILKEQSKNESSNKLFLFFCIALIFISSATIYFFGNKFINDKRIAEKKIKNIENTVNYISKTTAKNNARLDKIQKRLEQYESEKDVLADLVSKPVKQQFNINKDYALTEVEHLLAIANHNLLFGYKRETILSALQLASNRLDGFEIKEAELIQEQLKRDINVLMTADKVDVDNLLLLLSSLSESIDTLPLKNKLTKSEEKIEDKSKDSRINSAKKILTYMTDELRELIVIRRQENLGQNFLLENELNLLSLSIKLELSNARFALINRDKKNLIISIEHIINYLKNYYDLSNKETLDIYSKLLQIKELDFTFVDVDINSSLESLRALIRIHNEHFDSVD